MTLEEAEDRFDGCPRVRQWVAVHGVNREGDLSVERLVRVVMRKNEMAARRYQEGPGQAYLRTHPLTTTED